MLCDALGRRPGEFWSEAAKKMKAAQLSIAWPFPYCSAKQWKSGKHQISALFTLFLFLDIKTLLSLIQFPIEKQRSKTVPLRGAATNLRAIHLSIVYAFRYFVAKRWKIWKQQISALYMLFQLLATTSRAADLTSLYGSFIFSSLGNRISKSLNNAEMDCPQICRRAAQGNRLRSWFFYRELD